VQQPAPPKPHRSQRNAALQRSLLFSTTTSSIELRHTRHRLVEVDTPPFSG